MCFETKMNVYKQYASLNTSKFDNFLSVNVYLKTNY